MKKFIYILIFILIINFLPHNVFDEDNLYICNWIVDSTLFDNGDLSITEDITFQFKDEFNGVFREIVLDNTDGIEDFSLYEIVSGEEKEYKLSSDASEGDSDLYMIINENNSTNIQIFSPSEDEDKTFRLKYTLKNVAVRHEDTGEFYYKFLGKENETPIDYFSATIKLPKFNKEDIDIFGHGPFNGEIHFVNNDLIQLEIEDVPSETFIEARVLFPLDYISNSTNTGDNKLNNILEEEEKYNDKINEDAVEKEKRKSIFNNLSLIFSAITLGLMSFVFNRFRRSPDIFEKMDSLYPDLISPAEVGIFMNHTINTRIVLATLFDLSRRGYITIEEIKVDTSKQEKKFSKSKYEDKEFIFKKVSNPDKNLTDHEEYFIDWIFSLGNGEEVSTLDIKDNRKKHPSNFNKILANWKKQIQSDLETKKYFDPKGRKYFVYLLILYVIIITLSIFSIINNGFYGIILIGISIILVIYSVFLYHRKSDKGHIQYLLWKDFKEDISILERKDMDITEDESLIYAIALGVPMKDLNNYRENISSDYYPIYWGYWYFLMNNKGGSLMEDKISHSFYGTYHRSSSNSTGTSF